MQAGPDGPLFALEGEDDIYHELSAALIAATEQKQKAYERAVEVGAPLEELK
ncbi:hypothetical protein FQZ97_1267210 [compost metagenome]